MEDLEEEEVNMVEVEAVVVKAEEVEEMEVNMVVAVDQFHVILEMGAHMEEEEDLI